MKSIFWGKDGKDELLHVFIITSIPELSKVSFHQPGQEQGFPHRSATSFCTSVKGKHSVTVQVVPSFRDCVCI